MNKIHMIAYGTNTCVQNLIVVCQTVSYLLYSTLLTQRMTVHGLQKIAHVFKKLAFKAQFIWQRWMSSDTYVEIEYVLIWSSVRL